MADLVADLSGVRAKLRRAEEHQRALKAEVDRWAEKLANILGFKIGRDGPWYTVISEPIPEFDIRFAIIAGDLIHNLRSALDHLVWQLILRDGHEPSRWNEFPLHEREEGFFQEVKFRKRYPERSVLYGITVDGDAWAIIEAAQPYNRIPVFSSGLRIIGRLSNMDKHRTLYVNAAFPTEETIRESIAWNPEAVLLDKRGSVGPLSFKQPTEVVRFRFANQPDPNMHVQGSLSFEPTLGEGPIDVDGSFQVPVSTFIGLIVEVRSLVDSISQLPRVTR